MARPKHTENCGYFGKHENVNTDNIRETVKEYNVITERAKEFALARRNASQYNVFFIPVLIERLQNYLIECENSGKPLTVGGFILAADIPSGTWYDMKNGIYDNVVEEFRLCMDIPFEQMEYITDDGEIIPLVPYSSIIEKYATLPLQIQLETNCYNTRAHNAAGSIFALKARYDWQEDKQPQNLTQNLVIADSEQARRALDLLK